MTCYAGLVGRDMVSPAAGNQDGASAGCASSGRAWPGRPCHLDSNGREPFEPASGAVAAARAQNRVGGPAAGL